MKTDLFDKLQPFWKRPFW